MEHLAIMKCDNSASFTIMVAIFSSNFLFWSCVKKVQKQGRDERTQEDCPRSAKIHSRCRVVSYHLLAFFHLFLASVVFSGPSLLKMKFSRMVSIRYRKKTHQTTQNYTAEQRHALLHCFISLLSTNFCDQQVIRKYFNTKNLPDLR